MSRHRRVPRRVTGHDFLPPHCPNRDCPHYRPGPGWTWRKAGSFRRRDTPERFQCFRCRSCGRYFSVRTFAADYWLKRRSLLSGLAAWACEGPGLRQVARRHGISHATVMRHLARAARAALLFHGETLRGLRVDEPLVIDGFESFAYSQYFPFHLNLAAGADSWFLYGFTASPLRRKGRMTERQKARRKELEATLGRPDPKAVENGVAALLRPLVTAGPGSGGTGGGGAARPAIALHSDDHPAYPRALRRVEREAEIRFTHQVTSSRERRTSRNPLFPVNLADLLLRHGQANHRRETIAFSKRLQGAIERAALFQFWRNQVKRRRENGGEETAAMRAGRSDRPLGWTDLLGRRRFPRREDLPDPWWGYYWREVKTAALGERQATHRLTYAF